MSAFEAAPLLVAASAALLDVRTARIPNSLTMTSALAGLFAHAVLPGGHGTATSVGGLAGGMAVFFPFFALGGLGAGDVKLMAALGAWVGWPMIVDVALYTALAGGVVAMTVALRARYLRQAMRNLVTLTRFWMAAGVRAEPALTLEHGAGPRVPYAVPILAGLVVAEWLR